MDNPQKNPVSRRGLLKGLGAAGLVGVGAATGFLAGQQQGKKQAAISANEHSSLHYDCYGEHQAGIVTPHQPFNITCAFDVLAKTPQQLQRLLRMLTARIEFLTAGGVLPDLDPKLPPAGSGILGQTILPDGLTITIGLGASLFDERFGLADKKPIHLQEMKRFFNDALQADWCDGDLSLQFCANSPETNINAIRDIVKNTTSLMSIRWSLDGFLPKAPTGTAPRNLFGFRDGSANPDVSDKTIANEVLWTGKAPNSLNEPAWATNGTYQAIRLIRHFVEFWDRTPLQEQETIFGRVKETGAPLGKTKESQVPDYQADLEGKVTPLDAHIRLANDRTANFKKHLLFRRPYDYSLGLSKAGQLDMGLNFICYQANLEDGFIAVQKMLDKEPLEEYIKPFGGGYFFVLPGVKKGEFFGQGLFV